MNPKKAQGQLKPCIHYIPASAILEEAEVMELGARKYGRYNWRSQHVDATTYYNAIFRHLAAWVEGEDIDPESGKSHLAHIRASAGILLDALKRGELIDDRLLTEVKSK